MPVFDYYMTRKSFRIFQLGDVHDGTVALARKVLMKGIQIIKDDRTSKAVFTGDATECITVDDPRYEHNQHKKPLMTQQIDSIVENFGCISDRFLTWLTGNHEITIRGDNIAWRICTELGVPYGAWTTVINFRDPAGIIKWVGFWFHGPRRKSITSTAGDAKQQQSNKEASLKKILAPLHNAHYQGCGHFHQLILRSPAAPLYLGAEGKHLKKHYTSQPSSGYIHPDLRWYGCNGGFLRQFCMDEEYDNTSLDTVEPITYAEVAGYAPTEMGMIQLNIENYMLKSCEIVPL